MWAGCDWQQKNTQPEAVEIAKVVQLQSAVPAEPAPSRQAQLLDSLLRKRTDEGRFNGVVLLAHRGEILHAGAYGVSNFKKQDTLSLDSRFQLASVSKMFTAVGALKLVEQGSLDLDCSVKNYLPELPYPDLNLRHLLQHRSGLPRYMGLAHGAWDRQKVMNCQDVVEIFAQQAPELWFEPGSRFNYSNSNYALLAALIERVSGQKFDEFLQVAVFEPLGMHQTFVADYQTRKSAQDVVSGYKKYRRGPRDMEGDYLDGVFGDKGVYSSVLDLFKFDQALDAGKVLSPELQNLLFLPANTRYRDDYGMGWRIKTRHPNMAYHFGWWRGFRNAYIRDMHQGVSFIVLSNLDLGAGTINFWNLFNEIETCFWPDLF